MTILLTGYVRRLDPTAVGLNSDSLSSTFRLRVDGGVEGFTGSLSFSSRVSSVSFSLGITMGGVGLPELLDGELPVYIRSLSLSDSSPFVLPCLLEGIVKDMARGLYMRFSA